MEGLKISGCHSLEIGRAKAAMGLSGSCICHGSARIRSDEEAAAYLSPSGRKIG